MEISYKKYREERKWRKEAIQKFHLMAADSVLSSNIWKYYNIYNIKYNNKIGNVIVLYKGYDKIKEMYYYSPANQ